MCTTAMGASADNHIKTTKAIAEHLGWVHGNKVKQLVLSGKKSTPTELAHLDGTNPTDKDKAIWSMWHDLCLKQETQCKDDEAKMFAIVFSQCDKAIRTK